MSFLKVTTNPFEPAAKHWAKVEGNAEHAVLNAAMDAAGGLVSEIYRRTLPIDEWDAFRDGLTIFHTPDNVWVGLDDEDASTVFGVEYGDFSIEGDEITATSGLPPRPVMQPSINATEKANEELFEASLLERLIG